MAANERGLVDARGYVGSQKNRKLKPEEVIWGRDAYFQQRITVRQLARMWEMSADSVRKVLRGDTYADVGAALPRAEEVAQAMEINDDGALERLLEAQRRKDEAAMNDAALEAGLLDNVEEGHAEPSDGEAAIDLFLNGGKER